MRNTITYSSGHLVPKSRPTTAKNRRLKTGNSSSLYPVPTPAEPPRANNRVAIRLANILRGPIGI
jgi:hypothetical protein